MERVTAKRADELSTRCTHQSPVSFPADSTHLPSIWASRQRETSAVGPLHSESDTMAMDIYRDIVRDMSVDLDQN